MDWNEFLKAEYIWAIIGVFLLIMELFIPGLFVFFFGVGALAVGILCVFIEIGINTQLLLFIATSVVLMLVLRNWLKGVFLGFTRGRQDSSQNLQDFVGEKVPVTEAINPLVPGMVELHGTNWKARAERAIAVGTVVEIIGNDNLTLIVKPAMTQEGEKK